MYRCVHITTDIYCEFIMVVSGRVSSLSLLAIHVDIHCTYMYMYMYVALSLPSPFPPPSLLPTSLCSDGIDAVRGCVEEMKGQLPLDGVATSSRMVSAILSVLCHALHSRVVQLNLMYGHVYNYGYVHVYIHCTCVHTRPESKVHIS